MIYLIATRNLAALRIGSAVDVDKKFADMSEGARTWAMVLGVTREPNAEPLLEIGRCVADKSVKVYLHERWRSHRIRNEWFRFEGPLRLWALEIMEDPGQWDAVIAESKIPRRKLTIEDHPALRNVRGRPEQDVKVCSSCWEHDGKHRVWCPRQR